MRITIGRNNGPATDMPVSSEFTRDQVDIIKDVIAMVNHVSGNTENWFVAVNEGPLEEITVPLLGNITDEPSPERN